MLTHGSDTTDTCGDQKLEMYFYFGRNCSLHKVRLYHNI